MLISNLIAYLSAVREREGNIPVMIWDETCDRWTPADVGSTVYYMNQRGNYYKSPKVDTRTTQVGIEVFPACDH